MATIWIGDSRSKQLQQYHAKAENAINYHYLVEDTGENTWFVNHVVPQLPYTLLNSADVVFMLGFNDCVNSCIWPSFNIDKIATIYATNINKLKHEYSNFNFYVCSVNPVDGDYPTSELVDGFISATVLNKKIQKFNNKLCELCTATFLDSYDYFINTGFTTQDGIYLTIDTSKDLHNFITMQIKDYAGNFDDLDSSGESNTTAIKSNFKARSSAPNPNEDSFVYWRKKGKGGYNVCIEVPAVGTGITLPNCVGYAYGRFMEITGDILKIPENEIDISLVNAMAGNWYTSINAYEKGKEPRLGAVLCLREEDAPNGEGHVAIVEEIFTSAVKDDNNSTRPETGSQGKCIYFKTSESSWRNENYTPTDRDHFRLDIRCIKILQNGTIESWKQGLDTETNKFNWYKEAYVFQGFIYNPAVTTDNIMGDYIDKSHVVSKNAYLSEAEMKLNARYIWNYFKKKNWTLNAVAGMLGNMETESTINPGIWQSLQENANKGFGLTQWTPATKYLDWCNSQNLEPADIDSALKRIEYEYEKGEQYYKTSDYPLTFKEFSKSKQSASYLAKAFLANYERPKNPVPEERAKQGKYWYKTLLPYATETPKVFNLESLKIGKLSTTTVEASAILNNSLSCTFKLFDMNERQLKKETITTESNNNFCNIVHFKYSKLNPNTTYKLYVEVLGEEPHDKLSDVISFITPQAYPDTAESVKLSCIDTFKSPDSKFNLVVKKPINLGYWGTKNSGYDIQLIINNSCKKTLTINSVGDLVWENFTIKEKFEYIPKMEDNIQIGLRVWVTDNGGNKIYDSSTIKTSNAICLLNKSIQPYIKIN